eukprot:scaffold136462_cov178-Phaeocystis_antarctica.AAC.2
MEQRRSLTRPPNACSQKSACTLTARRTADVAHRCDHLDSSAAAAPARGRSSLLLHSLAVRGVLSHAR